MRRRRRHMQRFYGTVLAVALTSSGAFFLETHMQHIVPDLKRVVEQRIEEAFKGNVEVSIGGIEGGIFRDYSLKDVRIVDKNGVLPQLEFERIMLNCGLSDLVKDKKTLLSRVLCWFSKPSSSAVDMTIKGNKGWLDGIVRIVGDQERLTFQGFTKAFGGETVVFEGTCSVESLPQKAVLSVEIKPPRGSVRLEGELSGSVFTLKADVSHISAYGVEIICDLALNGTIGSRDSQHRLTVDGDCQMRSVWRAFEIISNARLSAEVGIDKRLETALVNGNLKTYGLIVNKKPFREIWFDFDLSVPLKGSRQQKVHPMVLEIRDLSLGKDIKAHGRVVMDRPDYPVDAVVTLDNLNITQLLIDLKVQMPELSYISGIANASFALKGPLTKLASHGKIDVRKGNLGDVYFESMTTVLRGNGPVLSIEDWRIVKKEGFVKLYGEIDLKNIKGNLFKDVRYVIDDQSIEWEGWSIVKEKYNDLEIKATKPVSDTMNVGFRTFINDGIDTDEYRQTEWELEYKLYQKDSVKFKTGGQQDYIGVEHREEF